MGVQEPLHRLEGALASPVGIDGDGHRTAARQSSIVEEGVGPVDQVLRLAVDVVVVGRGAEDEDLAIDHLLRHVTPVVVLCHAPLCIPAGLAPGAGPDIHIGEREKLGLDARLPHPIEDGGDESRGIAVFAHTSGDTENVHTLCSLPSFLILVIRASRSSPRNAATTPVTGSPGR